MNLPRLESVKVVGLLAATAVGAYVLYLMYSEGKGAVSSVRETFGNIGDSIAATWHEFKGQAAGIRNTIAPGEIGPAGGGSRQELQQLPTPADEGLDRLNDVAPYMLGAADLQGSSYTRDNAGVAYADDASAGAALPQVPSPDAMGSA